MIEVISNINCIPDDVLAAWREALKRGSPEAPLTASPDWFRQMSEGRKSAASVFVLRQDSGACVGVLPVIKQAWTMEFRLAGVRWFSRTFSSLRVVGGDLIENGAKSVELAALWTTLFRDHPDVDAVWMDHVMVGVRTYLVCQGARESLVCFPAILQAEQPHHYLVMGGDSSGAIRSRNTRRRLDRYAKALAEKCGPIILKELRTRAQLMAEWVKIEALVRGSWQAVWLGKDVDLDGEARMADAGLLRSFLLVAGSTPVAFLLGYQGAPAVICLHQIAYARELAGFGPGTLLLNGVLEKMAVAGEKLTVDFGSGEAGYKQHFTNCRFMLNQILVVRSRLSLRLLLLLYRMNNGLDRLIRMILGRFKIWHWVLGKLKRGERLRSRV